MSPAHYQLFTLAFPLFVFPQVEKTLCPHAYFSWGNLYCSILGGYISAEQGYMNLNGIVECCLFCQINYDSPSRYMYMHAYNVVSCVSFHHTCTHICRFGAKAWLGV